MRIFIINPNSDLEMTEVIQRTAENFSEGEFEVLCKPTPGAPLIIETCEDEMAAAAGMMNLVRENEDTCDAFVIACHCDPNMDILKSMTSKPVVGIGEASMRAACRLGRRFSIIQTTEESIPIKEALVRKYRFQDALASIRAPKQGHREKDEVEKYLDVARSAKEKDRADVIVLGCAGLTGMDKSLQEKLGIPVLDGVVCGLKMVLGLVSSADPCV